MCLTTCPDGYYKNTIDKITECKKCLDTNCKECSNSRNCLVCNDNFKLL